VFTSSIIPEIIIGTKYTLRKSLQKNETHFLCSYTCPLVFMVAQRIRQELATLYIHFETCLFNDCEWFIYKHAKLTKVSYSQLVIKQAFHMSACVYTVMCVIEI
jgi:hypothetical protein